MKYDAIVLAAGSGSRSGLSYNKVFYKLNEKTVIENSLKLFINDNDCEKVILVISESEYDDFINLNLSSKVVFAYGGQERFNSVENGLSKVSSEYVLIHDGARPYLSKDDLDKLKAALYNYNAALLMVKSIDTSKIVSNGIIDRTLDRSTVYNAQTPQAFKTSVLSDAYKKLNAANISVTDDSQIVEMFTNEKIKVVEGSYSNIKITTKEDLIVKYT